MNTLGTSGLKDKIALVTGADGGLGRHVTHALLGAGARVVGASRRIGQSDFESAAFTAVTAELSSDAGAKGLVDAVVSQFGRVDIVAHTVGGFAGGSSVAETDDAIFQRMMDVNFNNTLHLLRAVLPAMRQSGGRIVAIGSRAALEPGVGVGAYSASKAAMVSLMRTAALENRDFAITVNVILPGTMDTSTNREAMPNADFSKWVQPTTVASLIVWLAGDAGRDVNGAVIPVYGSDV